MKSQDTLKQLVLKEATALRQQATKEELGKLDLNWFDAGSAYSCIYGQMTDSCNSERAQELIVNCCERIYKTDGGYGAFGRITESSLGESPKKLEKYYDRLDYYCSPIEKYILTLGKENEEYGNKSLISYLKA